MASQGHEELSIGFWDILSLNNFQNVFLDLQFLLLLEIL